MESLRAKLLWKEIRQDGLHVVCNEDYLTTCTIITVHSYVQILVG
jgi:hypothetical protein